MKYNRRIVFDIPALEINDCFHANDYCVLSTENNVFVGMCEITGRRPSQEDCLEYSTEVAAAFVGLPEIVIQTALQNTLLELQHKYGQDDSGSTACITTAWIDAERQLRVWNANVGDSAAWLVTINQTTKTAGILEINTLHSPNPEINPKESKRTQAFRRGGTNVWVMGHPTDNLSLTRAIGDNKFDDAGILHEPELTRHVQFADPQEKYFLITACDGLTERNVLSAGDIATLVAANQDLPLHEIALKLVLAAYKEEFSARVKSYDNISVAIAEVTEIPISLAIFDGHGGIRVPGEGVSFDLGKHFYPTLKQKIALATKENDPTSQALTMAIRNKDWAMAVYILMTQVNCKHLSAKILKKINSHRAQLTDAFITQVDAERNKPTKTKLVRDVMNQNNALGIILNTPRYELLFKFTQREHNNKKVTGSIFKICEKLSAEVTDIKLEHISPDLLLGIN